MRIRKGGMLGGSPVPGRFRLFLVRHGHLENSEKGAINGQTDVHLSPLGQFQMERRAESLQEVPVTLLFSSNLSRTRESLAPIAESRAPLKPVEIPGFRERSFGEWEGKSREEIARQDPRGYARWQALDTGFIPSGGESLRSFRERVLETFRALLRKTGHGHNAVLVAHSGVNRILLLDALGMDLSLYFRLTQGYGALNIIDYTEGGDPAVLLMNNLPEDPGNADER